MGQCKEPLIMPGAEGNEFELKNPAQTSISKPWPFLSRNHIDVKTRESRHRRREKERERVIGNGDEHRDDGFSLFRG